MTNKNLYSFSTEICKYNILEKATALGEGRRVLHRRFCQLVELVTFVHCTFIFALRNIALGGYLDTASHVHVVIRT